MSIKDENKQQNWWNIPVFGSNSLVERIEHSLHKKEVPEAVLTEYKKAMAELRLLGPIAKALDNPKFSEPEFLFYLNINNAVVKEIGDYRDLKASVALFWVAIEAKNSFVKLEAIELLYCSGKQQEFYNFIINLLGKGLSQEELSQQIQAELQLILPSIKTEQGRTAVTNYAAIIENLAKKEPLGLKLIYLFKKDDLTDFSIIKNMAKIVEYAQNQNILNLTDLVDLANNKLEIFDKFANIISVPQEKRLPITYGIIIQYIILRQRNNSFFVGFQKLAELLLLTDQFYRTVISIQENYCTPEYRSREEFKVDIPGLDIYQKYAEYLLVTDNNSGVDGAGSKPTLLQ